VGAEAMVTANLWTEGGVVNGAYGMVDNILKPNDDCKVRIGMVTFPKYADPFFVLC
jgi:hypothetical protein